MTLPVIQFLLSGFTDSSGLPLAGGKVYTYQAGTTTPAPVYTDNLGAVPATNPVVLDSNGRREVYASGQYKFVITTASGLTLYTLDNLTISYGYANSQAEISALDTAGLEIIIRTAITLTGNLTISAPIRFIKGGYINTNGYTLTINGPLSAGASQIFVTSGAQVVFGTNATLYCLLEWFGAVGDGTTDDSTAIQLALNISATARIPVVPMGKKTYRCTGINVPQYGQLISQNARRSLAKFKSNGSGAMFTLNSTPDTFITFKGIQFDGNATASKCVAMADAQITVFEDCAFVNAGILVDLTGNPVWSYFRRCEFQQNSGTTTEQMKLSALATCTYIDECTFGGTVTYPIRCDTSWAGDYLTVENSTFGNTCTDMIKIQRSGAASNLSALIRGNRFDGGQSNSNINVGQFNYVSISDNSSTSNSSYGVIIDGQFCSLSNNFFSQSTVAAINVTSNSQDCVIHSQKWGALTSGVRIADAGTRTIIHNQQQTLKGTTANRPSGVIAPSATQYGLMYLDTTLDADGKPIWWNGVAWVDATGAVV